jgi:hypothetical protein
MHVVVRQQAGTPEQTPQGRQAAAEQKSACDLVGICSAHLVKRCRELNCAAIHCVALSARAGGAKNRDRAVEISERQLCLVHPEVQRGALHCAGIQ